MTKSKFIIMCLTIAALSGLVFYFNSDGIIRYFQNKEWEIADSFASVEINNFTTSEGLLSDMVVIGNNYVKEYSAEGKEVFEFFLPFQEVVSSAAGAYCVIGEKNGSTLYLISNHEKEWENTVTGTIYDVYVNKNGYVAVIFKQSGYKSLVKVIAPNGNELFTISLASTYAVAVSISNDNRQLAIAEVDADGIHIKSDIKMIDMNQLDNKNVQKFDLEENSYIVDIKYNNKNELLVRTDQSISIFYDGSLKQIVSYEYADTISATIENSNVPVLIKKEENGLFDVKYKVLMYTSDLGANTPREYELLSLPKQMMTNENQIILVMDKEILVVNLNGKLIKKFKINANVKCVETLEGGEMMAVIFRDKIEFVKI